MAKATLMYDRYGSYVEWYRDDDNDSGWGDHPQILRWYGTLQECKARMLKPAPKFGWSSDLRNPVQPGSAAWCEVQDDNF